MYKTDKIAILLATYQGEQYLSEQLESLLRQTNSGWKAYIHDDGSKDNTRKIIEKYVRAYPEFFVEIEAPSKGGAMKNFMFLLEQVDATCYMFCDQDDVWLEDKVDITYREMEKINKDAKPSLVFTDLKVVDKDLNIIAESMSRYQSLDCTRTAINYLLVQNIVTGCTTMVNRELRDEMLKYQDINKLIMHDWWAALIATCKGNICYIDKSTILYRQHGSNSVGAISTKSLKYYMMKVETAKDSVENSRLQAKELCWVIENNLVKKYASLSEKNKLFRIGFHIKNKVLKSGLVRNMGLIVLS